jgi:hypothetical protein
MSQLLQQASHTLHPGSTVLQKILPFRLPQLLGVTHWQLAMQSTGDSEPSGSSLHRPVVLLQL